jgi:hypothetical protein
MWPLTRAAGHELRTGLRIESEIMKARMPAVTAQFTDSLLPSRLPAHRAFYLVTVGWRDFRGPTHCPTASESPAR